VNILPPVDSADPFDREVPDDGERIRGSAFSFRTRLTLALVSTAVLPVAGFGLGLAVLGEEGNEPNFLRLLLLAVALAAFLGVFIAYLIAADLMAPLRAIAAAVERVSAGDLTRPIRVEGDDELARLAESHNRIATDTERRNRQLAALLAAISRYSPRDGAGWVTGRAAADARSIFELIEADILLGNSAAVPIEERVPGEPQPVRADVRAGDEILGVLVGHLPATATWERADQHLLELFTSEVGVAIRNAELFARVEAQNRQLVELDAAKDDFLRGVSHNLQTPLTSIRLYAQQLATAAPDRRLGIIAEQADRLSRLVRQLLTVSRLESGALRPQSEVIALGPRVRRAWEALAAGNAGMTLRDESHGWLAVGDPDQVDQVLWALLDNAVRYGSDGPIDVEVGVDEDAGDVRLTVIDRGPGVAESDRARLFARFARGGGDSAGEDGTGLGLYVSRELARAMGGDLVLEPSAPDRGAAFSLHLKAERALEA
jgi:signal transduction histidine kinase